MPKKCSWCGVEDANDAHQIQAFGRTFCLCDDCFQVVWALMDRLRAIGGEVKRRNAVAARK